MTSLNNLESFVKYQKQLDFLIVNDNTYTGANCSIHQHGLILIKSDMSHLLSFNALSATITMSTCSLPYTMVQLLHLVVEDPNNWRVLLKQAI